mmetsp:Transcript_23318/g.57386  ORF Transcript_23318/g.57386 Transcript_23318/m.57386 type:complete len:303 (-) Transcript_23318:151-1059(-)
MTARFPFSSPSGTKRRGSLSKSNRSTKEGHSPTLAIELVKETFEARRLRVEKECLRGLRSYCRESNIEISESLLFRFACFHNFDLKKAIEGIENSREKEHYINLKMSPGLREFFNRRVLFPLPGKVKTTKGHEMLAVYFRPLRFLAAEPSHHKYVVESLNYVLNDLSRLQEQSRTGVAVIINLAGHTNKNFHHPTVAKFLKSTEGELVPTKVNLVIMVDAPPIFKPLMAFYKQVFSMNFAKKVHAIKSNKLSSFFMPGYEEYLPNELAGGWRNLDEEVEDYVDLKSYEDRMRTQEEIIFRDD